MSSKPTTATSSKTRRPLASIARIAPRAVRSEAANTASMSGSASSSAVIASYPLVIGELAPAISSSRTGSPRSAKAWTKPASRSWPAHMSCGPVTVATSPAAAVEEVLASPCWRRRGCRRRRSTTSCLRSAAGRTAPSACRATSSCSGSSSLPWRESRSTPSTCPRRRSAGTARGHQVRRRPEDQLHAGLARCRSACCAARRGRTGRRRADPRSRRRRRQRSRCGRSRASAPRCSGCTTAPPRRPARMSAPVAHVARAAQHPAGRRARHAARAATDSRVGAERIGDCASVTKGSVALRRRGYKDGGLRSHAAESLRVELRGTRTPEPLIAR